MTKAKTYRSVQALIESGEVRPTSAAELRKVYGDAGAATDRELGVRPPKGRPRAGEKRAGTVTRSVRHTKAFFDALVAAAEREELTAHDAMRQALEEWLAAHAPKASKARAKRRAA